MASADQASPLGPVGVLAASVADVEAMCSLFCVGDSGYKFQDSDFVRNRNRNSVRKGPQVSNKVGTPLHECFIASSVVNEFVQECIERKYASSGYPFGNRVQKY